MSIILPWQKCPCGSGKPFYKCCSSLKHSYKVLKSSPNMTTKCSKIIIDETIYNDYLKKIRGFLDYHINQDINTNLKNYGNLLYYLDGVVNQFYKCIDCHKGCSHCCHMVVTITDFEAVYIKQHLENNWSKKQRSNLCNKVYKLKSDYPEIFNPNFIVSENLNKLRIPCIFLEDNCCSIYSVRPAICRTYISLSPSEICYKALFEPESQAHPIEINMYNDILSHLFDYQSHISQRKDICPIPYWFQKI